MNIKLGKVICSKLLSFEQFLFRKCLLNAMKLKFHKWQYFEMIEISIGR